MTAWFPEGRKPAAEPERLLARRGTGQEPELKFQRSNAPASVKLKDVAAAGGCRWSVEQDFQAGKGECGLDEYETRGWVGWHHHTALAMLALWFLTLQKKRLGGKHPQLTVPEVRAVLQKLLDLRKWDDDAILEWSNWRQERNRIAAASHRRRRAAELRRRRRMREQAL